jgi:crotonobetainyl-CoA:carnitine CoA-transferase CaiB-like acyl-CoA transferase
MRHIAGPMLSTSNYPVYELFHLGQLLGFPWAPVQSPAAVLKSPHLQERNFFKTLQQAGIEDAIQYPSLPFRCSNVSMPTLKSAPAVGEDNIKIYQDELGLSNNELERLSTEGVI